MIDKYVFSAEQNVGGGGAGTVISTNVADLGALTDDRGNALSEFGPESGKMWLVARVGATPFAGGTSVQTKLQHADTEGGTYSDVILGPTVALANLGAGAQMLKIPLPPTLKRYIRLAYVVAGSMTAGTVNAHLSWGAQSE